MTEPASLPLFVYGTLRDPAVRASLLGPRSELTTSPATLTGYARQVVPGFAYPFIVSEPGASVEGEIILGLRPADLDVLDEYEDVSSDLYARVQAEVETPAGPRPAWAYVKGTGE